MAHMFTSHRLLSSLPEPDFSRMGLKKKGFNAQSTSTFYLVFETRSYVARLALNLQCAYYYLPSTGIIAVCLHACPLVFNSVTTKLIYTKLTQGRD